MPGCQLATGKGGMRRQFDDFLSDVAPRVLLDVPSSHLEFLIGRRTSDHDPVAAGLGYRLHDQLIETSEHLGAVIVVPHRVGSCVRENRSLPQVVLDERWDVGIDRFVVGHTVADRVRHCHRSGANGGHQSGHPEHRGALECDRIQELIVDPSVNDVDPLETARRSHVHGVVVHQQIAPFDEFHPHAAGQKRVLEVGRVERTGGQHDDGRIVDAHRGLELQCLEQHRPVVVDPADRVAIEEQGKRPPHRRPVLDHVRDAARYPEVVLQYPVYAQVVTDDVDAGYGDSRPALHADAERGPLEPVGALDEPLRDDPVSNGGTLPRVEIVEEHVERPRPLNEAGLDHRPLG